MASHVRPSPEGTLQLQEVLLLLQYLFTCIVLGRIIYLSRVMNVRFIAMIGATQSYNLSYFPFNIVLK